MRRLRIANLPRLRNAARASGRFGSRIGAALIVLLLAACNSPAPKRSSTGVAFAGPSTLNLRKDLASKSAPVGSVQHGDRLEVLETRRRFVKVRSPQGVEGWTDFNLLLTSEQMEDLQKLSDSAAKLPSQGTATVYDAVNMHTEPSRPSPSFFQIPENGSVEVIGHRLTPRTTPNPQPQVAPVRRATPSKKAKGKESKQAGPPPPKTPSPPVNWQQLSRPRATDLPGYTPPSPTQPAPALDDWSLVRTRDGKTGWVLSRLLNMAIPDEVAQYAEGHRITSYLALGDVKDNGQIKHDWLWTTISSGQHPYEFDSFRVFVWSIRRHRYETAFIERNVKGYYPVGTEATPDQDAKAFSVVLEEKDGKLYKRTYAFSGYRVRMISKAPYQTPPPLPQFRTARNFDSAPAPAPAESGWTQTLREWRKRWIRR